jgi:hypothetical protein
VVVPDQAGKMLLPDEPVKSAEQDARSTTMPDQELKDD